MNNTERSEEIELFIEEFGEANFRESVTEESIAKWKNKLPDRLLKYWSQEGWASYSDGLFWFVNPKLYEDIVPLWLDSTPYEGIDKYHVIARTAFGELILWGENNNRRFTIHPVLHSIWGARKKLLKKTDAVISLESFMALAQRTTYDLEDNSGQLLFARAVRKLGMLACNEIYAFEPALILGGDIKLENLVKVDLFVHNDLLRSLAPPKMPMLEIDFDQIIKDNS
jgi:hypothetical protein